MARSLVTVLCILPLAVAAQSRDFNICVDRPLVTEVAQENFKKCTGASSELTSALSRVERICYVATAKGVKCAPGDPTCRPGQVIHTASRLIHLNVDDIIAKEAALRNLKDNFELDSCSKRRITSLTGGAQRKEAVYNFTYYHDQRGCFDSKLFGVWSESLCDFNGNGQAIILFDDTLKITTNVDVSKPTGKCLKILPANWVDDILRAMVASIAPSALLVADGKIISLDGFTRTWPTEASGFDSSKVKDTAAAKTVYVRDMEGSGFEQLNGVHVLYSSESGSLLGSDREDYIMHRTKEIKLLENLKESDPDIYYVKQGDRLVDIAQDKYGDPRMFLLLAYANSLDNDTLHVGQKLVVDQPHEWCKKFQNDKGTVFKGESVWSKHKKGDLLKVPDPNTLHSGKPDLIFPYEILSEPPIPH